MCTNKLEKALSKGYSMRPLAKLEGLFPSWKSVTVMVEMFRSRRAPFRGPGG